MGKTPEETKLAQRERHIEWAKDKAQISIRISQELKMQLDNHAQSRNETLAAFVVRAMKSQMLRDNLE